MSTESEIQEVRNVLQKFQDSYDIRDVSRLDEFMELFAPAEEIEWIGVGASERGGASGSTGEPLYATSSKGIGLIGARSTLTWMTLESLYLEKRPGSPRLAR